MKNQIIISIAILVVALSSCSRTQDTIQEKPDEKIILHYNNGNKFCEGVHQVYGKGNKEWKNRKGIWKFYYPDGKPMTINEYDEYGDIINFKEYNENGNLLKSIVNSETEVNELMFYENGNVKYESITKIEIKYDDENNEEYRTYYETLKEYHINGQLKSQKETVDDNLQGKAKLWDMEGNLLIEFEYDNGLIKSK